MMKQIRKNTFFLSLTINDSTDLKEKEKEHTVQDFKREKMEDT